MSKTCARGHLVFLVQCHDDEYEEFENIVYYAFDANVKKDMRFWQKSQTGQSCDTRTSGSDDSRVSKTGSSSTGAEVYWQLHCGNGSVTLVPQSMAQTVKVYLNTNPDPHIITRKPAKRKSEPVSDDSEDDADHDVHATVRAAKRFNPPSVCVTLNKAMNGGGINGARILRILTSCCNKQRQELKAEFRKRYRTDLTEALVQELGDDLEMVILGLMMEPVEFSAKCLYDSMYGSGTDERLLSYIILSCKPEEMKRLQKKYKKAYRKDMTHDVQIETDGTLQTILLNVIAEGEKASATRPATDDTAPKSTAAPKTTAASKHAAVESTTGKVHTKQNTPEITSKEKTSSKTDLVEKAEDASNASDDRAKLLAQKYIDKMRGKSDLKSIAKHTKGDSDVALLLLNNYLVSKLKDPVKYISNALYDKFDSVGTNRTLLSYVIISRSEIDLIDIMKKYEKKYKRPLAETIENNCRGRFKNVLLALLNQKAKT